MSRSPDKAPPSKKREAPWPGHKYIGSVDPEDAKAYDEIRKLLHDFHRMYKNTGISRLVLERAYKHLFHTIHEVPIGPNQLVKGYFSPDPDIADLWMKATRGELSDVEAERFRRLMAHEYVESKLMEKGNLPYRSADPKAWTDGTNRPTPKHHGAHDLAPLVDPLRPPFAHWEAVLGMKAPELEFAKDLGNLDELAQHILKTKRN